MSDAIRIEQRVVDFFSGRSRRQDDEERAPRPETPREMERRTVERLYGDRSGVVRVERDPESSA
jgi:hypothetical protein